MIFLIHHIETYIICIYYRYNTTIMYSIYYITVVQGRIIGGGSKLLKSPKKTEKVAQRYYKVNTLFHLNGSR